MMSYDYLFKIVLIGDESTGKSALLLRLADDVFVDRYISTIGVDFKMKIIDYDGKAIKLQLWDTAGQERFRQCTSATYRGAHGILCCYDVTSRESFDHVSNWMDQIAVHSGKPVVKILIGNKCDRQDRMVAWEEGSTLAEAFDAEFFETSAKESINVAEAVAAMTEDMILEQGGGAKTAVTLMGTATASGAQIACLSMAGNEMAVVTIEDAERTTWAKLRPQLSRALALSSRKAMFMLSNGSLLKSEDKDSSVLELLQLAPRERDKMQSECSLGARDSAGHHHPDGQV